MARYSMTPIPTEYAGEQFRSRLEARYAAFFDLVGWKWEYEPVNFPGWIPDFRVDTLACDHWECDHKHLLLVEVKPYASIDEFQGSVEYSLAKNFAHISLSAHDPVALFGRNPDVSYWEEWHGYGRYQISDLISSPMVKWQEAGDRVRWQKNTPKPVFG